MGLARGGMADCVVRDALARVDFALMSGKWEEAIQVAVRSGSITPSKHIVEKAIAEGNWQAIAHLAVRAQRYPTPIAEYVYRQLERATPQDVNDSARRGMWDAVSGIGTCGNEKAALRAVEVARQNRRGAVLHAVSGLAKSKAASERARGILGGD